LPKSAPDEVPSGVIIAAAAVREGLPVVVIQDESGSEKYSRLLKVLGVPVARNVEHAAELLLQLTQEPVPV